LPWEDLLTQLQDGEKMAQVGEQVSLPRTGKYLGNIEQTMFQCFYG
jgi:hypothetical protein